MNLLKLSDPSHIDSWLVILDAVLSDDALAIYESVKAFHEENNFSDEEIEENRNIVFFAMSSKTNTLGELICELSMKVIL